MVRFTGPYQYILENLLVRVLNDFSCLYWILPLSYKDIIPQNGVAGAILEGGQGSSGLEE